LSEQQRRSTGPERGTDEQVSEDEAPEREQEAESKQTTKDVLSLTDDVLDDIDHALKQACGFEEDEPVTGQQFDQRALQVVASYQQKGGQ
jgi:hypothetical protein